MDKNIILAKLQEVFKNIFDDESIILSMDTNSDDIEDWDSLAQINIIVALEKNYGVKFSIDEIISLKSVGDIVERVANKMTHRNKI